MLATVFITAKPSIVELDTAVEINHSKVCALLPGRCGCVYRNLFPKVDKLLFCWHCLAGSISWTVHAVV